jgi:hypothetical protein
VRQLVYAACFFEVGLLLLVLPWTFFWDRNYVFEALPLLHLVTQSAYVRGAVSGLGVINLGLGIAEVAAFLAARLEPPHQQAELSPRSEAH